MNKNELKFSRCHLVAFTIANIIIIIQPFKRFCVISESHKHVRKLHFDIKTKCFLLS